MSTPTRALLALVALLCVVPVIILTFSGDMTPLSEIGKPSLRGGSDGQSDAPMPIQSASQDRQALALGSKIFIYDPGGERISNAIAKWTKVHNGKVLIVGPDLELEGDGLVFKGSGDGVLEWTFADPPRIEGSHVLVVFAKGFCPELIPLSALSSISRTAQEFRVVLKPAIAGQVGVFDPDGLLVSGAIVEYQSTGRGQGNPQLVFQQSTDGSGQLETSFLGIGEYQISVRCPGFVSLTSKRSLGVDNADQFYWKFTLVPSSQIRGVVVEGNGENLGRVVQVCIVPVHSGVPQMEELKYSDAWLTSSIGREFVFSEARKGRKYAVVASESGRWGISEAVVAPSWCRVVLPPVAPVVGSIFSSADEPISSARVVLVNDIFPWASRGPIEGVSGPEGNFRVEAFPGKFSLSVYSDSGVRLFEEHINVPEGGIDRGKIVVPMLGAVEIFAISANSQEYLRGFGARPAGRNGIRVKQSEADSSIGLGQTEGRECVRLEGLNPGIHRVRVTSVGYFAEIVDVIVEEGKLSEVVVPLDPRCELLLTVKDSDGNPVTGELFHVELLGQRSSRAAVLQETNVEGKVSFTSLHQGIYEVRAANREIYEVRPANNAGLVTFAEVEVFEGLNRRECVLELLQGTVICVLGSGGPKEGAQVRVFFSGNSPTDSKPRWENCTGVLKTNELGCVDLQSLPPGDYLVRVDADEYAPVRKEFSLWANGLMLEVELPNFSISGHIKPADSGRRVLLLQNGLASGMLPIFRKLGAQKFLRDDSFLPGNSGTTKDGGWIAKLETEISSLGEFSFNGLGPGECYLFALGNDGSSSPVTKVVIGESNVQGVELLISPRAELTIEISSFSSVLDRFGADSLLVEIWANGELVDRVWTRDARTVFRHLPPGQATVRISARPKGKPKTDEVVLEERPVQLEGGRRQVFEWSGGG
jgi:hypothetical protein